MSTIPSNFTKQTRGPLTTLSLRSSRTSRPQAHLIGGMDSFVAQRHWLTKVQNDRNQGWLARRRSEEQLEFRGKSQKRDRRVVSREFYTAAKSAAIRRPTPSRPSSRQQRQFPPLPMTIHIHKPNLAQPRELSFHIQQLVRWILGLHRISDPTQKLLVQSRRG